MLSFHPDNAAAPLPDGLRVLTEVWPIDEDDAVLDALEADSLFHGIGEALPSGWAFAWLDDASSGRPDLGGWSDSDDEIEVELSGLITPRPDALAA
jgi:hypothetical protein